VFDVVVIGGGPAGLSAALLLGRCRRRVLVCDAGRPRNARARELHGYLTRDGSPPLELLRLGRGELEPYGVEIRAIEVTGVTRRKGRFNVALADRSSVESLTVLVASGVRDDLPPVPGLEECYGVSAHHCPYCDGWEAREKRIAVIGHGKSGAGLALSLRTWSDQVMLCANGPARLAAAQRAQLRRHAIAVHESRIQTVDHDAGRVRHLVMADGQRVACEELFLVTRQRPQCPLPEKLGCAVTPRGVVKTDRFGATGIPGLYVVGDASRDVQFVIVAAAEGAKAAVAINKALQERAGLKAMDA
jgi:thioredoxin reductase